MKKIGLFVISALLLVSIFSFTSSLTFVSAQLGSQSPQETIGQEFGINPETIEKIPKTPEEIRNAYLQQEWGKIITGLPLIGPIHNLSVNNPMPFKIAFAEPYSFSLVFFMILVLWILVAIIATKFAKATGFIDQKLCWIAGILFAIIIAQTKLYSFITKSVLAIIFSNEAWWIRVIIWVVVIGVLVIIHYFGRALSTSLKKYMEKRKQEKRMSVVEQKAKRAEAFVKGAEEGRKLVS